MTVREPTPTAPAQARLVSVTALLVLSVVATMAACYSSWFEWKHSGSAAELRPGQWTGLGLFLPHFDFSATASFTTATREDWARAGYVGWSARLIVTLVLVATLVELGRTRRAAVSASPASSALPTLFLRALMAVTVISGLWLLVPGWLMARGLYDIEYTRIVADAPVRLVQVLPLGPILLGLAVVLQVAAWRILKPAATRI
jgi:hypothetical protein